MFLSRHDAKLFISVAVYALHMLCCTGVFLNELDPAGLTVCQKDVCDCPANEHWCATAELQLALWAVVFSRLFYGP